MSHISDDSYYSRFDAVVLGAGHAGCEAALALSRMGLKTLCLAMNLDSVALMACNPAIGGTSKGHLVREIDALGGEMGLAADDTCIQIRMLNTGKGPAVHSLRAQMDKRRYHERMKSAMEHQANLTLMQGEAVKIIESCGKAAGVVLSTGETVYCRGVVAACGVYLKSRVFIGDTMRESGPSGLMGANGLSASLASLGFPLRRFKTGTPPRIAGASVDFGEMEPQPGDVPPPRFSFISKRRELDQSLCYLTYTNDATHDIIRANMTRSAMYSGLITGTGTRYCPSIEDKINKFPDRDRHQVFIEPEGLSTDELYVQGMSTSLPLPVQRDMLHTMRGLESCIITRPGYAIEYDCIEPSCLDAYLGSRDIKGLYFAGQINGSSGYEEAAAQGLYAGINLGLYLMDQPPLLLTRADAYIGVLCDDLSVKGTNEPYRMMTSRAEYRLLLRQDNADLRLTELSRRTGLISDARYDRLMQKKAAISDVERALSMRIGDANALEALDALLAQKGEAPARQGSTLFDILRRGSVSYTELLSIFAELPDYDAEAIEQAEVSARYGGYIEKQKAEVERFRRMEDMPLPAGMDYMALHGLRIEARQKLSAVRPPSLGAASRISGVSPADISVLMVALRM